MWIIVIFGIVLLTVLLIGFDFSGIFSLYNFLLTFFNDDNATFWFLMFMVLLLFIVGGLALQTGSKRGFSALISGGITLLIYNLYSIIL